MSDYRGQAPGDVTAWERTVAVYKVARMAGARLRARDLIRPDPERWFTEYAGPLLSRIERHMHAMLEERIRVREIAMGIEQQQIAAEMQYAAPQGDGAVLTN